MQPWKQKRQSKGVFLTSKQDGLQRSLLIVMFSDSLIFTNEITRETGKWLFGKQTKNSPFCIINFSQNQFVWEVISNIRHSFLSQDQTLRSLSEVLPYVLCIQFPSQCLISWDEPLCLRVLNITRRLKVNRLTRT